mmetsp:Transcript_37051/g.35774  ORF Transcript_37051/g.35774 Transcript_37051/m.35774 type:complete len:103 (-) Transcript_37051:465-773(-)
MPFIIRIFLKFIYDECYAVLGGKKSQEHIYGIVADFLINDWLLRVCFEELNKYGLTKSFFIGTNCKQNLKLLSKVMEAIFKLDYEELRGMDDIFKPFQVLFH